MLNQTVQPHSSEIQTWPYATEGGFQFHRCAYGEVRSLELLDLRAEAVRDWVNANGRKAGKEIKAIEHRLEMLGVALKDVRELRYDNNNNNALFLGNPVLVEVEKYDLRWTTESQCSAWRSSTGTRWSGEYVRNQGLLIGVGAQKFQWVAPFIPYVDVVPGSRMGGRPRKADGARYCPFHREELFGGGAIETGPYQIALWTHEPNPEMNRFWPPHGRAWQSPSVCLAVGASYLHPHLVEQGTWPADRFHPKRRPVYERLGRQVGDALNLHIPGLTAEGLRPSIEDEDLILGPLEGKVPRVKAHWNSVVCQGSWEIQPGRFYINRWQWFPVRDDEGMNLAWSYHLWRKHTFQELVHRRAVQPDSVSEHCALMRLSWEEQDLFRVAATGLARAERARLAAHEDMYFKA